MARIRTLKPEFWIDEKLAPLAPIDRLVFIGLISQADDDGRLVDNVRLLDGLLFPETEHSCRDSLETLARLSRIVRYTSLSGQKIIQITKWEEHQRVDKPSKHTLPPPPPEVIGAAKDAGSSRDPRETLARPSGDPIAPTLDLGPRTMEQGPGSEKLAPAREADSPPDEEPPLEVDADTADPVIHAGQRMSASQVLHAWESLQPVPIPQADRQRHHRYARKIADNHTAPEVAAAFVGMGQLWEHDKGGQPWDLNDLDRKFAKALAKARDHPEVKARQFEAEFMQRAGGVL